MRTASLLGARAPAGEPTATPHGSEAFLGVHALVFGCHDQQLVADLDPLTGIWIEGSVVANDQGHHRVLGKPKLAHLDSGEPRLGRDANLKQISRNLVEWRDLYLDIMRSLVVVKPE